VEEWVLDPAQYARLWNGLRFTLALLASSFVLGVVLSLIFGVARLSERRWVRGAALAYVEFARGISSVILLFILVIATPILLDLGRAPVFQMATIALGINMGGYGAEIVRGAIQAIPKGQTEASVALNLSATQRLRYVVLPQAMRLILPPMGNLTIEILKGTALVSVVGGGDLMQSTFSLRATQLAAGVAGVTVLFVNVLLMYFVVAQLINAAFRYTERRLDRRFEQREGRSAVALPAEVGNR
jgi:polar amino acid transport system permease protein